MSSLRQRRLDEDTSKQEQAVADAKDVLRRALLDVEAAARSAGRARSIDLTTYLAAHLAVLRGEEALAIALTDLASASGEDV